MSAPDIDENTIASFKGCGIDHHLTLLLGAGASSAAGLPDWNQLAARLLIRSKSVASPGVAESLIAMQDPMLVTQGAKLALGKRWEQAVRHALYENVTKADPTPIHNAVAAYTLKGTSTDTTLLTLNFDTLLETALRNGGAGSVETACSEDEFPNGFVVRHLHGVAGSNGKIDGLVLTLADFNAILAADSWQFNAICRAVASGAVVIVGTSYRDPDLRWWMAQALRDRPAGHAALVLLARQAFGLSRQEFDSVKKTLADQWRSIGLQPILLEDFSDVATIIQELRYFNSKEYATPQQRAQTVWRAHEEYFTDLQRSYYSQLTLDADDLRAAFEEESLNITLWLADGNKRLARWVAQDRLHRGAEDLRLIHSGHDSPWIAGRALASESMLFENLDSMKEHRWKCVAAIPIRVPHPSLPAMPMAVLSVGLPGEAEKYGASPLIWRGSLVQLALDWGRRLADVFGTAHGDSGS